MVFVFKFFEGLVFKREREREREGGWWKGKVFLRFVVCQMIVVTDSTMDSVSL